MYNNIEIVASGNKWIDMDVRSTFTTLYELIDEAQDSLLLTAYVLTEDLIFTKIERALGRGVKIEIFIRNDEKYKIYINKLHILKKKYGYTHLIIYVINEYIHAKLIIADQIKVYIGSANLSNRGLYKNYELGICFVDENIAFELEKIIKRLI